MPVSKQQLIHPKKDRARKARRMIPRDTESLRDDIRCAKSYPRYTSCQLIGILGDLIDSAHAEQLVDPMNAQRADPVRQKH